MEACYYNWEFPGTINKWNSFYAFIHVHQFIFLEYHVVAECSQDQSPASTKALSDQLHTASDWNRNLILQERNAVVPAVKLIS